MSRSPIRNVLHYLHQMVDPQAGAESADRQLLARFVNQRDEFAFEALVRRHGPMVLAVCRRLLSDADDAEDAFQATFLIFVRKAATIARPDQLAGWLHGVATRVAGKARQQRLRRPLAPLDQEPSAEEPAMDDVMRRELATALDEEVARLPAPYQMPFILCHLSGRSNEEAARELGCPTGTIYSRLARAREILRERLARRGLVWSTATLAVALTSHAAPAAVPPALLQHTVSSGMLLAAGQTLAAGAVSGSTLTLMEATLRTMYLSKLKSVAMIALVLAVSGTGLGLAAYHAFPPAGAAEPVAAADKPEKPAPEKPAPDPNEKLRQEVKTLQERIKAVQERQQLEAELKRLREQIAILEGKPIADGKLPQVTYQGKTVDHWLQTVRDCDPTTRITALRALGTIGDELGEDAPRAVTAITAILKADAGPPALAPDNLPIQPGTVQAHAVYALAAIGPTAKPAIPKLVALQIDADEKVHEWLANAVGAGLGAPLGLAVPMQGIPPADPGDDQAGWFLTQAMLRIDPDGKSAVPLLHAAIQKPKPRKNVAINALSALRAYREHAASATPAIIALLRVDEEVVRYDAYMTLKGMQEEIKKVAVPALIALSRDKDKDTAEAAAGVLNDLYPKEAEEAGVPNTTPPRNPAAPM